MTESARVPSRTAVPEFQLAIEQAAGGRTTRAGAHYRTVRVLRLIDRNGPLALPDRYRRALRGAPAGEQYPAMDPLTKLIIVAAMTIATILMIT